MAVTHAERGALKQKKMDFAREFFKAGKDRSGSDALAAMKKEFGGTIDFGDLYAIRREVYGLKKVHAATKRRTPLKAAPVTLPEAKERVRAQAIKGYSMARLPKFVEHKAKELAGHMSDLGITEIGIEVTSDKKEVRWRGQAPLGVQPL